MGLPAAGGGSGGIQVRPIQPARLAFGAVVTGVDLGELHRRGGGSEAASAWATLESALLEHGLLCIRGQQDLSTEGLVDFAAHW
eukprot:SAG22_NODE_13882_length_392_cov_0.696246_1_plen_83_part_10